MKCHYEVLDVPRDADEAVIKTAYKKLALKWHPDKNLNSPDEAKEQFQFVQQAYEVLSDRQERAWYDNHREQILHGSNKDFEDKNLDVFQYFTTSCFKGYNDDDGGFYTVYRKVFEDIAKEDMEYLDEKEDFCNIPMFGSSISDYEAVGMFYSYWSAYSTKKSYVWVDPYNIKDIRHRKLLKLVEKDNKKARIKAKKERNEEVRNLVAFVRKRDKRVIANTKKLEAKVIENREKQKEISKQKRIEKQKSNMENTQAEWTKFDNVKAELEEIEKSLVEEFGRDSSTDESDEEFDNLYCAACNKVFKTPKAFENHESSKKHKENVEFLKEYLQEEEDKLKEEGDDDEEDIDEENIVKDSDEDSQEETEEIIVEDGSEMKSNCSEKNSSNDEISSEETFVTIESKSKKKNRKVKNTIKPEIIEEPGNKVNEVNNSQESDDDFKFSAENTKKQKKKNRKKDTKLKDTAIVNVNDEATNVKDDFEEDIKTKKANKRKKERGKNVPQDIAEIDKDHCCVACKAEFNSKNKLFDHLKKTGHSTYLPPTTSKNKSRTLK